LASVDIPSRPFAGPFAFLHSLETLAPGCVLTDLRMPSMSGLELRAALTQRGVSWPVILMSGHSDMESNGLALEQGILEIIEKPFKLDALRAVLDRGFAMLESAEAPVAGD
jgi:two-component system response regulator FixJ